MKHRFGCIGKQVVRSWRLAWLTPLVIAGCAVGPNFKSPQPQLSPAWSGTTTAPTTRPTSVPTRPTIDSSELSRWWKGFHDPELTSLIERAIVSNLDVKQAQARIRQARALRNESLANLGPTLGGGSSFSRSHNNGSVGNQYQAGLDAGWEIDVFGGLRRQVEASQADLQATVESSRDTMVTLTSEVALAYIDLRSFQERIEIAEKNLRAQQHTADVTRQRKQAGYVGALDVANAEAQVASTASQIPTLQASAQQAIHSLSVLLGQEPTALEKELRPRADIPMASPQVPVGVPADLLRRRPDIRKAEASMHAATARIGVATADLLPTFNLNGSVGYSSSSFHSWTDWGNRFWSFGPSMNWSFFNSGANLAAIDLQKAVLEENAYAYQLTVLSAMRDVEDAMIAAAKEQERRTYLADAVSANTKAVQLSTQLYTQGQIEFLNLLDAQRSLYTSEEALVLSYQNLATDLVSLYKALGGGWDENTPETGTRQDKVGNFFRLNEK